MLFNISLMITGSERVMREKMNFVSTHVVYRVQKERHGWLKEVLTLYYLMQNVKAKEQAAHITSTMKCSCNERPTYHLQAFSWRFLRQFPFLGRHRLFVSWLGSRGSGIPLFFHLLAYKVLLSPSCISILDNAKLICRYLPMKVDGFIVC